MPISSQEVPVDRVPFEWRQVQVRKDGQEWKLVSGTYTLANFGREEHDARLAQVAIQSYHASEHCVIGYPQPCFSYFLANGQALRGQFFGAANLAFRPESLGVRNTREGWAICEGDRLLFHFGDREHEARQALKEIQKYHFDTLSRVGRADGPALTFLTRSR
jgi:hypothetical protein